MSRSWCVGVSLLAIAAGCLLPEGTVDPDLDTDIDSLNGGAGGAGGTTSVSPGAGGSGIAGSTTMMAASGSGGTTSPVVPPPLMGVGGATATEMGVGGTAGSQSMGAAGAGGSTTSTPLADCVGDTEEVTCAAYCQDYEQACGDYSPAYTYTSLQDCLDTCNTPGTWPVGSITTKGSILCRCYHATLALNGDKATHCFHAAEKPSLTGGCEL